MKVSIKKISEITGFSPATVSNALNRKKGVNPVTAEIILKTAQELGYKSGIKITKIKFVIFRRNGKIIDGSQFHPSVIEGVEQQAKRMGYETVFCYLNLSDADYETQVNAVLNDMESAVVLLGTEMLEEDLEKFRDAGCPLILLDGWSDEYFFDAVLISNTDSACRAVEYLMEKGHEKIGYLAGEFRIQAFCYREIGYERALARKGITVRPEYRVETGTTMESAYEGVKEWLGKYGKETLPTAFFADNDVIAIGAMRAFQEAGIRIPEDVSIIGFDNIEMGVMSNPPLTTVNVYKKEMGAIAVRRLMEQMEDKDGIRTKIQVCTDFVERESVKARGSCARK